MAGRRKAAAAVLGALFIFSVAVSAGCSSSSGGGSSGPAPDFVGVTLDGRQVSLSDYLGKPLVLVFTASWCGTCKLEAPELDRFYQDNRGKAEVLAMAVNDTEEDMRAFMADGGWDYPVMLDADRIADAYGVRFIPTLVLIDSEGRIAKKVVNKLSASEVSALVDGLTR
jgi:thiol-disulfide isomerase/thioredoxin